MANKRSYKHTEEYLHKKALREKEKAEKIAKMQEEKSKKIAQFLCTITPETLFLEWLKTRYGITEQEFKDGSTDQIKAKLIKVAKEYLESVSKNNNKPTPGGLEEYYLEYAIKQYCSVLGISIDIYKSLKDFKIKEEFTKKAFDYAFGICGDQNDYKRQIDSNTANLLSCAEKMYNKMNNNDLRFGSKENRNAKRLLMIKLILKHFKNIEEKTLSIRDLEKIYGYNRNTMGRYYRAIKSMLILGLEINENSFEEKKRGRKPKQLITIEMLNLLEKDLENLPEKCGLKYASWTGEAIREYLFKFFHVDIPLKKLYKFLHAHNIVSKFACRKNPKSDPVEVEKFKKGIYAKFKHAIINDETIVFVDETQVQQGSHTRGYAVKGNRAVYSYCTENLHSEYTLLSFIGFDFVMIFKHKGSMTSEDYASYLFKLHSKYPDEKFVIFQDSATIHTSEEFTDLIYFYELDECMRFEAFPKYSPELNPVELMNNEFKYFLKQRSCDGRKNVSKRADDFIAIFQDADLNSKCLGRRKARQYTKGQDCSFIYEEYLRAKIDCRKIKLEGRKLNKSA